MGSQWTLSKDKTPGIIILLLMAVIAVYIYNHKEQEYDKGQLQYKTANTKMADGHFEQAIEDLNDALAHDPKNVPVHLSMAISLMQMGRDQEAMEWFDKTLALDPGMAAAYANRGILNDKLSRFNDALFDYRKALELDPELAKGPNFLWRFLRNVDEKPPTIADRADYLEAQLALPADKRVLKDSAEDDKQRMYKVKK